MPLDFRGYRVIVTGASRGIGRAIAGAFATAGAAVSICARGAEGLAEARDGLARAGGPVHAARCDLAHADEVAGYVTTAVDALGGLDVLVNNASGFGFSDDEAGWTAGIDVDLLAPVRASRAALPALAASRHGGSILHIASIAALRTGGSGAPYGAVKAALVHYARSQALALARQRIRVNALAPGSISFPGGLWEARREAAPEAWAKTLAGIPFGRYGTPEEVAHAALFLSSPWAGWITGQTLAVDGGQMLHG